MKIDTETLYKHLLVFLHSHHLDVIHRLPLQDFCILTYLKKILLNLNAWGSGTLIWSALLSKLVYFVTFKQAI